MPLRKHVVITGTGRSGTTFLVELLTSLGLETGFSIDDLVSKKSEGARAGLEYDIRESSCPYIVKSPWFCDYAEEVISRDDIEIEHIFIPIRDLDAAAESRRYVVKAAVSRLPFIEKLRHIVKPRRVDGGLWHTNSSKSGDQEEILLRQIYNLMFAVSDTCLPVTLMRYPRIAQDPQYLFEKLKLILRGVTYETFCTVFNNTVRPELVHSFSKKDF